MELGRSAPMLMSASPGRGGGDGAGAGRAQRGYGVIGNDRQIPQHRQSAACPQSNNDSERPFLCPITARPCEGDLAHLCEDYGLRYEN